MSQKTAIRISDKTYRQLDKLRTSRMGKVTFDECVSWLIWMKDQHFKEHK